MKSKNPTGLSKSARRRLNMYGLAAAGAAGVTLLAATSPAEASVVYSPANAKVGITGELVLDLNNDGIPDFALCLAGGFNSCKQPVRVPPCGAGHQTLMVLPAQAESQLNEIYGTAGGWAAPLPAGERIGAKVQFSPGARDMAWFTSCPSIGSGGPWAGMRRYLGLKFMINGQVHYGWARLVVGLAKQGATLTGYAYETIPGLGITMGQTKGLPAERASLLLDDAPDSQPPALGMLALGERGIPLWRRKVDESTPSVKPA